MAKKTRKSYSKWPANAVVFVNYQSNRATVAPHNSLQSNYSSYFTISFL